MEIGSLTLRDWALFLGAYMLWCPVALLVWRFVRKRFGSPIGRAIVFGVLFAPGVVPILREAYVVGPALLALGYFGAVAALGSKVSLDLAQQILKWSLGPMVAFISAYVVVIRLRQLR